METTVFTKLLHGLKEPAFALLNPSKRVYWPALAGAALIATALLLMRGVALRRIPGQLLSAKLWLHQSARVDYQFILFKALLGALFAGSVGISTLAVAAQTAGWLRHHVSSPSLTLSPLQVGVLFSLSAFLAEDFSRYFLHRLMHRVPLLWAFHKVHHSAEVLTPFTLYRTHPVEAFLNGIRGAVTLGLVTGLFAWLFYPGLRTFEVLGVELIGFVWALLGANLRHSHVWVSYGRLVEHLLISPAQHQVHHSQAPHHLDRNFGTILAIWDYLGGSLYTTQKPERLHFGLPKSESTARQALGSLLLQPFLGLAHSLRLQPKRASAGSAALLGFLILGTGCNEPKRLDRAGLLQSFGQCTLDRYRQTKLAATRLLTATQAYAVMQSPETLGEARAAWSQVMENWQVAELLRYGPAADFQTIGGKGLREGIYSWPDVNRCLIEEQLVARTYEGASFASTTTSTRGLGALEYLLFYSGVDNACGPLSVINSSGSWAGLTAEELARRKAAYARVVAADVEGKIEELVSAWEPNGFLMQLAGAGRGSTLFTSQQPAISAVAEALFFLDTEVKDLKLATPLGIKNCTTASCPSTLESLWADRGKQHLRSNLVGLRVLLEGCPSGSDLGFDDLLESVGAPALATQMSADLAAIETAISGIPSESLAAALSSDRASVMRVYDAVKELTDFLKLEFSMALAISSQRVEGDHD